MTIRHTSRLAAVLLLALGLALAVQAQGQPAAAAAGQDAVPVRVLEIRAGQIFLDGVALPADNLPEDLNLDGLNATYRFSGPVTPVLEIDGIVYVLEDQRLMPLSEAERAEAQIYFLGQPDAAPAREARSAAPMPEEALQEASEEAYLRELSARDRSLYEQIRYEQALELETLRLADRILRNTDASAHDALVEELREKLEASFDLKQRIRADEIGQAEAQIGELRRMLGEREANKEQIVTHRLRELIGDEAP